MPSSRKYSQQMYDQQIEELRNRKSKVRVYKAPKRQSRKDSNDSRSIEIMHINHTPTSTEKQRYDTNDIVRRVTGPYSAYVDNIEEMIEKRPDMVPLSVYDQQRENWSRANDKLQQQMRQLKAANEDQNLQMVQLQNNQNIFEDTIEDLKDQKNTLKAKIDELESLIYEKDDATEIMSEKLNHLQNEYEARNLTKDKMIDSLQIEFANKNDEFEEMKRKFEGLGDQLSELGEEYENAIQEFNEGNDALLKRNQKLKTESKELLQKQVEDMDDREGLLKQIQTLQTEKVVLRKKFTENIQNEVFGNYGQENEDDVDVEDINFKGRSSSFRKY